MAGKIPWEAAQRVAEEHGCRQVILVAWDGEQTHVVTFGWSASDSDQAAQGGNFVKEALGWPERLCEDESPKVANLRAALLALVESLDGSTSQVMFAKGKALIELGILPAMTSPESAGVR